MDEILDAGAAGRSADAEERQSGAQHAGEQAKHTLNPQPAAGSDVSPPNGEVTADATLQCPVCRHGSVDQTCGRVVFAEIDCPVCLSRSSPSVVLPCGHTLCKADYVKLGGKLSLPNSAQLRKAITLDSEFSQAVTDRHVVQKPETVVVRLRGGPSDGPPGGSRPGTAATAASQRAPFPYVDVVSVPISPHDAPPEQVPCSRATSSHAVDASAFDSVPLESDVSGFGPDQQCGASQARRVARPESRGSVGFAAETVFSERLRLSSRQSSRPGSSSSIVSRSSSMTELSRRWLLEADRNDRAGEPLADLAHVSVESSQPRSEGSGQSLSSRAPLSAGMGTPRPSSRGDHTLAPPFPITPTCTADPNPDVTSLPEKDTWNEGWERGLLTIVCNKAEDLAPTPTGKADPYLVVTIDGVRQTSKVKRGTLQPTWYEQMDFSVIANRSIVQVEVFSSASLTRSLNALAHPMQGLLHPDRPVNLSKSLPLFGDDRSLGSFSFVVSPETSTQTTVFDLQQQNGQSSQGTVELALTFFPKPSSAQVTQFRRTKLLNAVQSDYGGTIRAEMSECDAEIERIGEDASMSAQQQQKKLGQIKQYKSVLRSEIKHHEQGQTVRNVQRALNDFQNRAFQNMSHWAAIPDKKLGEHLQKALHEFPDYTQGLKDVMAIQASDRTKLVQELLREEESLLESIKNEVKQWNQTLETEMIRMQETISELKNISMKVNEFAGQSHQRGASRVAIVGVKLNRQGASLPYGQINGHYMRTTDTFGGSAVYNQVKNKKIAMWWSNHKQAWCVGPTSAVGTDHIWAYVEESSGVGPEEAANTPWMVYDSNSDVWEKQAAVKVRNISRDDVRRPRTASIQDAAHKAKSLKTQMRRLNAHVNEAARVIGWLEFAPDDPLGRQEFVGQLLQEEWHGEGDGVEDGLGSMTWNDGATYVGEFKSGRLDGLGHETYADGSSYQGQFVNDIRHGLGVFSAVTGEQYSGFWRHGDRHGLGWYDRDSSLDSAHIFGHFVNGVLETRVRDDIKENELKSQMEEVINDVMEIADLATSLVPQIRDRAQEFFDKTNTNAAFAAAFVGPQDETQKGIVERGRNARARDAIGLYERAEGKRLREPKAHHAFESWLTEIRICYDPHHERIGKFSAQSPIGLQLASRVEKMCKTIRKLGYEVPGDLVGLVLDANAFDSFNDAMNLRARQRSVLWRALEDLEAMLTPPSSAASHRAGEEENFNVGENKLAEFGRMFEKFCDKTDESTGAPRMGPRGLHLALQSMKIQHNLSQVQTVMTRIDTNNDGYIDLDEFMFAVSEVEKARVLAREYAARNAAEDEIRTRKVRELSALAAAEREKEEEVERQRIAEQERLEAARRMREAEEAAARLESARKEAERKRLEEENALDLKRKSLATSILLQYTERALRQRAFRNGLVLELIAVNRLKKHMKCALARISLKCQLQQRTQRAQATLQGTLKQALARGHFLSSKLASETLQGMQRRVIPVPCVPGSHQFRSHTLEEARYSVKPAAADVVNTHLRIQVQSRVGYEAQDIAMRVDEQNRTVEKEETSRYLNSALLSTEFWARSALIPMRVVAWLREIDQELHLQNSAELEITTMKAASNILFRAWVRRKVLSLRQRARDREARLLREQAERQQLESERLASEARRLREWQEAEREMTREKHKQDAAARKAASRAKRLEFLAQQEAAAQQHERDRAMLRTVREMQDHERQSKIAEARSKQSRLVGGISTLARAKLSPLKSKMSAFIGRKWGSGSTKGKAQDSTSHLQSPLQRLATKEASIIPWDDGVHIPAQRTRGSFTVPVTTRKAPPTRLAPLTHTHPDTEKAKSDKFRGAQVGRSKLTPTIPELPAGAVRSATWVDQPHAAVKPRTSVRRILLIQAEIRLRHIRRQMTRQAKQEQQRLACLDGEVQQQEDATASTSTRYQHISEVLQDWERTMAAIARLENREQDAGCTSKGPCAASVVPAEQGLLGGSWLPVPVRVQAKLATAANVSRPKSIGDSILRRRQKTSL